MPQNDHVFLIEEAQLRALPARPFRAGLFGKTLEEALQTLIERHPDVLPGSQIDPDDPPRFALLGREIPIGSWALDHVLVDQAGVLTLIETKLAENPESRREVIGQILEYAANAEANWRDGRLQERAAAYWAKQGQDVDDMIRQRLGNPDLDIEHFWRTVHENLRQGRLRLLLVADELRPEVRRIIEYLNREMENAEVYGLELQCYGTQAASLVLVPRLVGQTQAGTDRKHAVASPQWTVDRLRTAYAALSDPLVGTRLRALLDWAVDRGCFMPAIAKNPTFGLQGRGGTRIFTFFADGSPYWFANAKHYPGGQAERDRFFAELRDLSLVDSALDPNNVVAGRTLSRKLGELREGEVKSLVDTLGRYCAGRD